MTRPRFVRVFPYWPRRRWSGWEKERQFMLVSAPLVDGYVVPQCFRETLDVVGQGRWTLDFEAETGRRPRCVRYGLEAAQTEDEVSTASVNWRELFNMALAYAAVPEENPAASEIGRHVDPVLAALASEAARSPRRTYHELMLAGEYWSDARADPELNAEERIAYTALKLGKSSPTTRRIVAEARKAGLLSDSPDYRLSVFTTRLGATLRGSNTASFWDSDQSVDLVTGESHETTDWDVMRTLSRWRIDGKSLFECQELERAEYALDPHFGAAARRLVAP